MSSEDTIPKKSFLMCLDSNSQWLGTYVIYMLTYKRSLIVQNDSPGLGAFCCPNTAA